MTTQEVAALLGVSPDTVLNWVKRQVLTPANPVNPLLKRPRRLLFRRDDVLALKAPHLDATPPRLLAEDRAGYDPNAA